MNESQSSYAMLTPDQKQIVHALIDWCKDNAPSYADDEDKERIINTMKLGASMAIRCMVKSGYVKIGRG